MCAEGPWRVWSSRDTIGLAFSRDPHWHTGGWGENGWRPLRQLLEGFTGEEARA